MNAPTLHLGGTSFEELYNQHTHAIQALRDVRVVVSNTCPHPRDFIRRDSGYKAALDAHCVRLGLLTEMIAELERIRESICKQNDEREEMKGNRK
jgi:hypothetical protein